MSGSFCQLLFHMDVRTIFIQIFVTRCGISQFFIKRAHPDLCRQSQPFHMTAAQSSFRFPYQALPVLSAAAGFPYGQAAQYIHIRIV